MVPGPGTRKTLSVIEITMLTEGILFEKKNVQKFLVYGKKFYSKNYYHVLSKTKTL